jgi:hypothetical protein
MKRALAIVLVLFASTLFAQSMLAEITEPVQTEFGLYSPNPVIITPNAPACDPGDDLQNVINLGNFSFSAQELALLKQNHFVVAPAARNEPYTGATGYNEIFDLYNENREQGIPIFITTDAMLHTFHLCFDYILKTCEEKRFIGQLNELLDGFLEETQQQYSNATEEVVRQALLSNLNYLIVAKKLLDTTYVEPINGGKYLEELSLIKEHQGFLESPIFGYYEDYSQYIVRGHYTRSDSLRHYFQSMMWLGRMTFACEHKDKPFSRDATRRAILLVQAMTNISVEGRPAMAVWEDIYQPTVFFVGKSDDINFYQYQTIAEQIYGDQFSGLPIDSFADESLLTAFLEETAKLPGPAITYPGQPKGFRFMGQRFIPDSYVLDEVVFSKIPDLRTMPTGLDVMAVLGSQRALALLQQTPDWTIYPSYPVKLASLRQEFAGYTPATWAQNAYWNWLYSLMPLLAVKGPGYPDFMQTLAWLDKDLYAALASWAELRHDTILYAKQSGTETGLPPSAIEKQGYVEPNPHFYGRLASLSNFMIQGLDSRGLLFDNFKASLEKLSALLLQLKSISEKELANTPLSSSDYMTIFDIGKSLYDIITFSPWPSEGPPRWGEESDIEPMPVIADVHTDANSGLVLEEGVGYPYAIYVICNLEGRPVITKGAGYSYFEFTWPMNDRLTDEKWRQMLVTADPPQPPSWIDSFFAAPETGQSLKPDFYYWGKPGNISINATFSPDTPKVGDTIQLAVSVFGDVWNPPAPTVWLTKPSGERLQITDLTQTQTYPPTWTASVQTGDLSQGIVYVDISEPTGSGSIDYRASFYLKSQTNVEQQQPVLPGQFRLYQNQPNPFNPATVIYFDLPRSEQVALEIFDLRGRLVQRLGSGYFAAGTHSLSWDGKDQSGRQMSSGVYYYRLHVGDYVEVKRMVLLR